MKICIRVILFQSPLFVLVSGIQASDYQSSLMFVLNDLAPAAVFKFDHHSAIETSLCNFLTSYYISDELKTIILIYLDSYRSYPQSAI